MGPEGGLCLIGIGIGLGFSSNQRASDGVAPRKITLIDGEFLKGFCRHWTDRVGFEFFKNLNWNSVSESASRTFYYDSLPAQRSNQTDSEFRAEYEAKIAELDHIRSQRWYHVKDGVSRYRRRDRKREQKGVDILLAIDAVQMATQGLADEITIPTSDTDFFPVFEMMNQTKCRGILRYQRGRSSDELVFAADQSAPIELRELAHWCGVDEGHHASIFPKAETSREKFPKDVQLNNDPRLQTH